MIEKLSKKKHYVLFAPVSNARKVMDLLELMEIECSVIGTGGTEVQIYEVVE